ncbi:MAG: homocysteine S-methyltransferase family protein [Thermoleophilaceae bacterium]|nr:homocysteine S-methyltransferase family protein [Thermoleophilaceae bacterium]
MALASALPQLDGGLFLTDGGLETDLIFNDGVELPEFAAFVLLDDDDGLAALRRYYARFTEIADRHDTGFVLESPTWRSNPDWGEKLGYGREELTAANRRAIELMIALRGELAGSAGPIVVSGCVGPRGDGYVTGAAMTAEEAAEYHRLQVEAFDSAGADMVSAITMTNVAEATGVATAAAAAGIPSAISFTIETDSHLPDGTPLLDAIVAVDDATGGAPAYYMINCAHPDHFSDVLDEAVPATGRIRGLRANASRMSHEELDAAEELDDGDPLELGAQYAEIRQRFPAINVLGGCCGTDARHVAAIADACS